MTHSMADPFSVQLNVAELSVMLVMVIFAQNVVPRLGEKIKNLFVRHVVMMLVVMLFAQNVVLKFKQILQSPYIQKQMIIQQMKMIGLMI